MSELQLGERLRERRVLARGHAGLARELEDPLGDVALAGGDDLRRAVARIAQRGRDLLRAAQP